MKNFSAKAILNAADGVEYVNSEINYLPPMVNYSRVPLYTSVSYLIRKTLFKINIIILGQLQQPKKTYTS